MGSVPWAWIFSERPEEKAHEHGGTRTPDIQNRNLTLYPTELHALIAYVSY